ncbi:MAG: prolyl-tRNA synthetase associated domain-containing protein [Kordiimonas sp.]
MTESPDIEAPLFNFLDSHGIKVPTVRHASVFTVLEAQQERDTMPEPFKSGGHCKSLFVRDKKKRRALVMVDENRRVDLKALSGKIGLGRLSFGSADSLKEMLGVIPGSVTPFALINAQVKEGEEPPLVVALDKQMMQQASLNYHPLHNAATTAISPSDLIKFIRACGYEPLIVDLDSE